MVAPFGWRTIRRAAQFFSSCCRALQLKRSRSRTHHRTTQRSSTIEYKYNAWMKRPIRRWKFDFVQEASPDSQESFLRANITFSNFKENAIDEPKCVIDHEGFQFAIVAAAPIGPF